MPARADPSHACDVAPIRRGVRVSSSCRLRRVFHGVVGDRMASGGKVFAGTGCGVARAQQRHALIRRRRVRAIERCLRMAVILRFVVLREQQSRKPDREARAQIQIAFVTTRRGERSSQCREAPMMRLCAAFVPQSRFGRTGESGGSTWMRCQRVAAPDCFSRIINRVVPISLRARPNTRCGSKLCGI